MERSITTTSRYNRGEKSREKNIISMYRRIASCNNEEHMGGIEKMGKTPINTIGGGGCMRRCTENASQILEDLAVEIWIEHKGKMRDIGMRKPSASVAIDCLIYHSVECGMVKVKEALTPENNLYLAIID
jgi:hypothetical protein